MAAHVANGSGAKIKPFAPVYWMVIFVADIGTVGANAEPKIPIEVFGHGTARIRTRAWIAPGFRAPGMDFFNLADNSVTNELDRHPIMRVSVDLDAHLSDQPFFMGELGQPAGFMEIVCKRLLAINVFAQLHGAHGRGRMHVVRKGNIDRIDILRFFLEEFSPILVDFDLGKSFLQFCRPAQIHFSNSDEFQIVKFRQFVDVGTGLAGGAEAGMANDAVGRLTQQAAGDKRRAQGSRAESFQERAAGESVRRIHRRGE